MEEKKLTAEEIVKKLNYIKEQYLSYIYNDDDECKVLFVDDILDLIHRLQDENNQIKSNKFASWKLKFFNLKDELKKELSKHEEFTQKAKEEIERLKTENGRLLENKKQVDVLTAEKENLYFLNKNLEDYIDNHESIWKRNTEQAVKDTVKEILDMLYTAMPKTNIVVEIKKRYGVEVE